MSNDDDLNCRCSGENCSDMKSENCGGSEDHEHFHERGPCPSGKGETPTASIVSHTFVMEGLDCADCAASINKVFTDIPGVKSARINFSSGKVDIEYDSTTNALQRVKNVIIKMGYNVKEQAGTESLEIHVPEMDCSEEIRMIQKKIDSLDGIVEINYYPVNRRIKLLIDRSRILPGRITAAIAETGMTAEIVKENRAGVETSPLRSTIPLVVSVIAFILALLVRYLPPLNVISESAPVFFALSIIFGGILTFRRAVYSALHKTYDMNLLMTIAVLGAVILGEWIEAGIIVLLFALAQVLEDRSLDRARKAIRDLMEQSPETALVNREGEWMEIPSEEVRVGETLRVKPGARIPLDGVVADGASTVNQAAITGESLPVNKSVGDQVFAGTVNERGSLDVRVTHEYRETTLAKIVHMVEEAQSRRAPAQKFIDRFSRYYTPTVMIIALLIATVPVLFFGQALGEMVYRALVLLLIACPCALVISTPVSILSGLAHAAKNGVLIKGGVYLENLAGIDTLAFDKTGTLTKGKPAVIDIISLDNRTENEIIGIAAGIESLSEHLLAEAVVNYAREKSIIIPEVTRFQSITGMGVQGEIKGEEYFVGSHRYFCLGDRCSGDAHKRITEREKQGHTVAVVGNTRDILGIIVIADTLREEAKDAVKEARKLGVKTIVLLTGDHVETARSIAEELNIDYRAELLPQDKVLEIKKFEEEGKAIAMVGDGVNDAPALAASSVGVAMGAAGSDTALEVADIALLSDDLSKIPFSIRLSRNTLRIIKQNIVFAIGLKLVILILAGLGLATLWMAVFADMGASLIVIFNGLRLLRFR
jgi:Zn2+/Cd2+-exporting ATPase